LCWNDRIYRSSVYHFHVSNIQLVLLWLLVDSGTVFFTNIALRQNWPALLIDIFLQKVDGFLIHRKYKTMYYEQAENAIKDHANELKQMIGNVAHDIKTVSDDVLLLYNYLYCC